MPARQDNITEQLCRNTIFEGLTREQIADILPCIVAAIKTYGSEERVFGKGEKLDNFGVVLNGSLKVCDEQADGKQSAIASIEKNGLVGEANLFATGSSAPHSVVADKNTQVLYLSGDFVLSPCSKECQRRGAHKEIVKNMLRILSDKTVQLNKKILYLTAPDLKTKIAMYLCELCDACGSRTFTMPLNRDRLAEVFAVARPSLSREFIALKNAGIIDFHRSAVTVLDEGKLREIAANRE
jgi:CRP-like cAMP-binding protein